MKFYFYSHTKHFIENSHLFNQKFYTLVDRDVDADFIFVSLTGLTPYYESLKVNTQLRDKKIVLYNLTEPISFGGAKQMLQKSINYGIDSNNIFFHSTNHFLDQFNCLHKGLSIKDHLVKSQLSGVMEKNQRFLKYTFLNNAIRKPRAMVISELLKRNLFFNQCFITCNTERHYGNKNVLSDKTISDKLSQLQSYDSTDVYHHTSYENDLNFQPVYKSSFMNFVIETFSDFGMDNKGFNSHLTEKTIRNFIFKVPFLLLISSEDQIKVIESLGFKTYNHLFDFNIDLNDIDKTIIDYTDVIEKFTNMSATDVRSWFMSDEVNSIIEHNHNVIISYRDLNIENIYTYILKGEYENKNTLMIDMNEPDDIVPISIISNEI